MAVAVVPGVLPEAVTEVLPAVTVMNVVRSSTPSSEIAGSDSEVDDEEVEEVEEEEVGVDDDPASEEEDGVVGVEVEEETEEPNVPDNNEAE